MKELENGFTRKKSSVGSEISTAKTKMSANELKVFYQVSTLIDKDDDKFMKYTISVKDFVGSLGFSQTNIKDTKDICRTLAKQCFEIQEGDIWRVYPIFAGFEFDTKAQMIGFEFNDKMRPYLLNLKQFTKIENVEYIKQFESKYAIRIYALLKDYRKMAYRDFDMEDLHKILQLPKSYLDYGQFKKRVLDPAIVEINEKSDLFISKIEEIKKQRKKVLRIRIHFENKATKIAEDKIKYLLKFYKDNKEAFGYKAFLGFKYEQDGVIRTITRIHQEKENNYHAIYCDHSDNVSFSCHDGKTFLNRLCNGIHNAIEIEAEQEKQTKLDLIDWQDEQERINAYKEIMRKWIEKRQKESVRV
ncbi:replication initiation protein [Helicobacter kayseriensis]|uniref:replication initiation protein n=1 Tax=Helicobacter kayseriensis TaxID=2905877 RepID=UPI001E469348|nr:replication initiation protein [Helicobacter kayseriensis]MCE3047809.1 replication initiation protein [Helicobacter kayseriensis]MCE3049172.1 replication initiation protein [Helicobacter kayseriensis]